MITIEIKNIIKFYDEQDRNVSGQVSSITGLIGEDLGAGLIQHYFKALHRNCIIYNDSPTEGTKKGKWLDRWIKVKNTNESNYTYYQTEIKNWSSHSIGGKKIALSASLLELNAYAKARFDEQWNYTADTLKNDNVSKVLKEMKKHPGILEDDEIKPLICFWYPIFHQDNINPIDELFEVGCSLTKFRKVTFFSMSTYLRKLLAKGTTEIQIEAPNIEARQIILKDLLR
ncbi:MAG: hypothetical protein ACOYMA_13670 [Bacteroidia bacterium]